MTAEQAELLRDLGFALLGVVCFGPWLYAMGRQHGRAKGIRETWADFAKRDAETMRREQERRRIADQLKGPNR